MLAILLLAAGRSSRMGDRDKLMEVVDGAPLLRTMVKRAQTTGAPVFVVLPPDRPDREAALDGLPVTPVQAHDAHLGMAHSLRAGVAALPVSATAAMILPADMPDITAADLASMRTAQSKSPTAILRATTSEGKSGHPVVFPSALFPDLLALSGDAGARAVLAANKDQIIPVALPANHAQTDLDTPTDWARWRASRTDDIPT